MPVVVVGNITAGGTGSGACSGIGAAVSRDVQASSDAPTPSHTSTVRPPRATGTRSHTPRRAATNPATR